MAQKTWLVTGCSTGLGKRLIQLIVQRGDKAIATARNLSAISELADAGAKTIQLDITATEYILKEKVKEAIEAYGSVDVVVHNAGYFQMGTWEDLTHDLLQKEFHTNLFGVVNLTRALIPHFRERKDGTIVFINSTAAWQTFPGISAYGGTKAALDRMADALAREVGVFGIKVLSIEAGGFASNLNDTGISQRKPGQHYEPLMQMLEAAMNHGTSSPMGDVAKMANLILDLVRGEGLGEGKYIPARHMKRPQELFEELMNMPPNEVPLALPVGSDAIEAIKGKCEAMLKVIETHEALIRSTDV